MPVDDFDAVAKTIRRDVDAGGMGFISMVRNDLREAYGIGRLTERLGGLVNQSLEEHGLWAFPSPAYPSDVLRIYDLSHPVGRAARAVTHPDEMPDTPLREHARLLNRHAAGAELRSDDVPWLEALELLMELAIGHEPQGWEDVRDDRHGLQLARELAGALDLESTMPQEPSFLRIAAAMCADSRRRRSYEAQELVATSEGLPFARRLVEELAQRVEAIERSHYKALQLAAQAVLGGEHVPGNRVELGLLGLRRKVEVSG